MRDNLKKDPESAYNKRLDELKAKKKEATKLKDRLEIQKKEVRILTTTDWFVV